MMKLPNIVSICGGSGGDIIISFDSNSSSSSSK